MSKIPDSLLYFVRTQFELSEEEVDQVYRENKEGFDLVTKVVNRLIVLKLGNASPEEMSSLLHLRSILTNNRKIEIL